MSEDDENLITIWDRRSDRDEIHLRSTLAALGMSPQSLRMFVKERGLQDYAVLPRFKHLIAPAGDVHVLQVRDDGELRRVIGELFENCAANGIHDVGFATWSPTASAIVEEAKAIVRNPD